MQAINWFKFRSPTTHLCLILIVYGVLLLSTVERHGISWDEQTDLGIARSYISQLNGWFVGSPSDPSQTRLPMFAVAVVYALLNADSLIVARLVSCLVGALTIAGIYFYCARVFDHKRGLLASALLATSPFFLSFAGTAFTETDIYLACAFAWLLVCLAALREKGTVRWATFSAIAFGLAISAKFTAVAALPVFLLTARQPQVGADRERLLPQQALVGAVLLAIASVIFVSGLIFLRSGEPGNGSLVLHYVLLLCGWVAILSWAARHRDRTAHPLQLSVYAVGVALLTFFVVPPVHTTNPLILGAIAGRIEREMLQSLAFAANVLILDFGFILFKSSPAVGLGLLVSLLLAGFQWKRREVIRTPLLLTALYFFGLVTLPSVQTFYVMPLLPLLAVLGADRWFDLYAKRRELSILLGVLAATWLCVDLARSYPDYNLNGYQYVGAGRFTGRSTIGTRSLVQTTADGVQQAAAWLDENALPGERASVYIRPWHIWRATLPDPSFVVTQGEGSGLPDPPSDYVVLHINHKVGRLSGLGGEPTELTRQLHEHYRKVFSVQRAFDIEVASVWKIRRGD